MPGESRPPPSRFPCDLGFVEGDFIECLNAGDGQWWMGRLMRNGDVGPFPSNFVEILEEPGPPPLRRPLSRAGSASPMPFTGGGGGGSLTRSHSPAPPRQTRNVSPREGYEYDTYGRRSVQKRSSQYRDMSPERAYHQRPRSRAADPQYQDRPVSRARSPVPPGLSTYQHGGREVSPARSRYQQDYRRDASPNRSHYQMDHRREVSPARSQYQDRRAVSPVPPHYRVPSPAPPHFAHRARVPSPAPPAHFQRPRATTPMPPNVYNQRAISPAPPIHLSRQPSPEHAMMYDNGSGPPPPPPPHQHLTPGNSRPPSPHQHTPSPLRSAMEDVMSSLEHMVSHDNHDYGIDRATTPHIVDDPWSPHAFRDEFSATPSRIVRPHTSLGVGAHNFDIDDDDDDDDDDPYDSRYPVQQPPGGSYSEAMQDHIQRFQVANNEPFRVKRDDMPPPLPPKRYTSDELAKQQYTPNDILAIRRPLTANFADKRKSIHDLPARGSTNTPLSRNTTVKSSATSASFSSNAQSVATNSTGLTSISLMSGHSAGCTSATSAGSYNRRKRTHSVVEGTTFRPPLLGARSETPISVTGSGSGHASGSASGSGIGQSLLRKGRRPVPSNVGASESDPALFGGHQVPKPKKAGIIKTLINRAKATTANARSTFNHTPPLPTPGPVVVNKGPGDVITGIQGGQPRLQGPAHGWAEVRRDVNRSNSLSRAERDERSRRVQMLGHTVLRPVDLLDEVVDGDAAADGKTAVQDPADFVNATNLAFVDKTARFINNLPLFTTPESLATMHICKSYRTEVQKLRAIFTWLSEKVSWERPTPPVDGVEAKMDLRRVLQVKRGSPEEVANIVMLMCRAVGIEAEVIPGYLKAPGEMFEAADIPSPNHFWNAVVCEGEWRMMDCSLASPTHPRRVLYSGASNTTTEFHYFLTPPSRICWTHVPSQPRHQHMIPPLPLCQLLALPVVTSVFFQHDLKVQDFDTSLIRLEGLEALQIDVGVPVDIELIAEVEARGYAIDADGEIYESDQVVKKRALAQVAWDSGHKTYRIKAVTPGDVGAAVLKVYAGRKGLMHSIKDNPHPLAFCLPIAHTGENPLYDFIPRHPTPHATRHDLYVAQPQCYYLGLNNTYVFAVRQNISTGAPSATEKPAKLALQTPTGKILRLIKKGDTPGCENGVVWETIVKVTEAGAWRALVLADRSHRWCVYAEWHVS
ncbi:hypothetical protein L211DRAFT_896171 [Terfezia boudieri ATCC MYA-4762]|uniref:SH3 domain-containing protein n=1 Tax=Terfezia boudieri ATCC MYA-4762 TaxID=1051890 RepID=A0A3N4LVL4_9PEZI|nr:hypothetical protein L211DRAFT_896171 [Terfezia boudieri ATCC MYA-4762]